LPFDNPTACQERAMKNEKAFTLIELLTTFIILGIMLTLAIPAFSRWLPNYHLRSASDDLQSEFQLTKMKAIKDNGEWALVFNAGAGTYQVVSGGADGNYSTAGDNVVVKTVTLSQYGSGTRYGHGAATAAIGGGGFDNEITFAADTVVFNGRGMINSAAGGYVYLQNNENGTYGAGVLSSGVVIVRKWDGAAWK
jgi:Tfp pilus assembly protein FimT